MGFVTGLTGGLTVTLSIAYLSLLAHQRNRADQSHLLRTQAYVLDGVSLPARTPREQRQRLLLPPPPAERAEQEAARRAHFVETVKERWNGEIAQAVAWAQGTDWTAVREDGEAAAGRLWRRLAGGHGPEDTFRRAEERLAAQTSAALERSRAAVAGARGAAEEQAGRAKGAAKEGLRSAWNAAGEQSARAGAVVREQVGHARESAEQRSRRAADSVVETTDDTSGAAQGLVQRGLQKGREMADKARAAVGLAGEKVMDVATGSTPSQTSDVERVLDQRYTGTDRMDKSVDEVLAERYAPSDKRNSKVLRSVV